MTKRNALSTFCPLPVWPACHGEYGARYQSETYLNHIRPERTMGIKKFKIHMEKKWRAIFLAAKPPPIYPLAAMASRSSLSRPQGRWGLCHGTKVLIFVFYCKGICEGVWTSARVLAVALAWCRVAMESARLFGSNLRRRSMVAASACKKGVRCTAWAGVS